MAHDTPVTTGDDMRKFALFAALAGIVSAILKKQRDRELDEAIWEEPRDL